MCMSLQEYLESKYSPLTAKRYRFDIDHLLAYFPQGKAKQLTYQELLDYVGVLRKKYSNPDTVKCALQSVKKYYQYLQHTHQRKDNPAQAIRLRDKSSKDVQLQDLFSEPELALLLERKERYSDLQLRNQVVISLLIYQGLTTGEITRLKVNDIDLTEGLISIGSSRRTHARKLSLQASQVMLLHQYITQERPKLLSHAASSQETDRLILTKLGTTETGEGISYLVSTFRYLFPDRRLNPKTIRQSVIANLLRKGKDLRVVQTFAGHKYPSATERYKQSQIEELKAQVNKYHPIG